MIKCTNAIQPVETSHQYYHLVLSQALTSRKDHIVYDIYHIVYEFNDLQNGISYLYFLFIELISPLIYRCNLQFLGFYTKRKHYMVLTWSQSLWSGFYAWNSLVQFISERTLEKISNPLTNKPQQNATIINKKISFVYTVTYI